jgi:penicillin-binding protein 1A
VAVAYPNVPEIGGLADYRPKLPMRIYAADGVLLGEFGEERRNFTPIAQIPKVLKDAVLAAEDARFYEHGGVDYKGIARAALANLRDARSQGGSTITMQVAKNFYLPTEKTYTRKIYELLLTLKIEKLLSKEQILELYMNQIFLGQRAYGFAAASEIYFGKAVKDLDIAEAAMLAGLPVAPSAYNPIVNPKRATVRQQFILGRMLEKASSPRSSTTRRARRCCATGAKPDAGACRHGRDGAPARVCAVRRRGLLTRPGRVPDDPFAEQEVAYRALRRGLLNYEQRQFYRGPEAYVDLPAVPDAGGRAHRRGAGRPPRQRRTARRGGAEASPRKVVAVLQSGETITVTGDGLKPVTSGLSPRPSRSCRSAAAPWCARCRTPRASGR